MRRVRGVLVMALLWALAWVVLWLPVVLYITGPPGAPEAIAFYRPPLWQLLRPAAIWGAISGATFAGFVAILGSRRGWSALGARHALGWGALSGLVAPVGLTGLVSVTQSHLGWTDARALSIIALVSVVVNGALAAGTIALAKRGESSEAPVR